MHAANSTTALRTPSSCPATAIVAASSELKCQHEPDKARVEPLIRQILKDLQTWYLSFVHETVVLCRAKTLVL